MRLQAAWQRFVRNDSGAGAAEFALVIPVMLAFLFGIMDIGRFAWAINRSEKATQMGARMAVVTGPVASGLTAESYVGKTIAGVTLTQGDQIPAAALGLIQCNSTSCSCVTGTCPATLGYDSARFTAIVTRMAAMNPRITADNVLVEYRGSGLGFAGDPGGMEIAPLTTVKVQNLQYVPLSLMVLKQSYTLPSFAYSLTMEDGSGTVSN
jgi:Flp pilus assembly protein TadG